MSGLDRHFWIGRRVSVGGKPGLQFRDQDINVSPSTSRNPAHRQTALLLPALRGALIAAKVSGYLLPAVKLVF